MNCQPEYETQAGNKTKACEFSFAPFSCDRKQEKRFSLEANDLETPEENLSCKGSELPSIIPDYLVDSDVNAQTRPEDLNHCLRQTTQSR